MATFVVDWHLPAIQDRVSQIEALGLPVAGAEANSPQQAVSAIHETAPEIVIVWANDHLERTLQVVHGLRAGKGDAPRLVYVDAGPAAQAALADVLPGTFVTSTGLGPALADAARAIRR